jgi:hypothetical protein
MLYDPWVQLYEDEFLACIWFALQHVGSQKKIYSEILLDVTKSLENKQPSQ